MNRFDEVQPFIMATADLIARNPGRASLVDDIRIQMARARYLNPSAVSLVNCYVEPPAWGAIRSVAFEFCDNKTKEHFHRTIGRVV